MSGRREGRRPNPPGRSTIYLGADGYWHGRVTVGKRDDGRPYRAHVQTTTREEVAKKVAELERQRDKGIVRKPGERWRVSEWLRHWVGTIAVPHVSENTHADYQVNVSATWSRAWGRTGSTRSNPSIWNAYMRGCRLPATTRAIPMACRRGRQRAR